MKRVKFSLYPVSDNIELRSDGLLFVGTELVSGLPGKTYLTLDVPNMILTTSKVNERNMVNTKQGYLIEAHDLKKHLEKLHHVPIVKAKAVVKSINNKSAYQLNFNNVFPFFDIK